LPPLAFIPQRQATCFEGAYPADVYGIAADDDKSFFAHGLSSGVEYQGEDETVLRVAQNLSQLQIIVPCLVSIAHEVDPVTNSAPEVGHSASRLAIVRICALFYLI
jgi:hypothetical protein